MKVENTKAQMRKGVLEYCILSVLAQGELYPSDIIGKLKDAKLIVVEGTLYPLLTRLKDAGLLTYRWEESRSGPPRKYYKLTTVGDKFLTELDQTLSLIHIFFCHVNALFVVRCSLSGGLVVRSTRTTTNRQPSSPLPQPGGEDPHSRPIPHHG